MCRQTFIALPLRNALAGILALLSFAFIPKAVSASDENTVQIGYVLGLRSPSLQKEYKVAVELLMKRVFKDLGVTVNLVPFDSSSEALEAFAKGRIDVTEISAPELVRMPGPQRDGLEVVAVSQLSEQPLQEYVFLTANGNPMSSLKEKSICVVGRSDWNQGMEWLGAEVFELSGFPLNEFFKSVEIVDVQSPGEAALPTFFGKYAGCMITHADLELLSEINPQIGKKLKPVLKSPGYPAPLFVCRKDFSKVSVPRLIEVATALRGTPEGQQALTLMKLTNLRRFDPADLKAAEAIVEKVRSIEDKTDSRHFSIDQ